MRQIDVKVEGRPPTPNSRRHHMAVATDNKKWKHKTWLAAGDAMTAADWPVVVERVTVKKNQQESRLVSAFPMQNANLEVVIVVPDHQRRDWDNGVSSLKPLLDGCVAAQIIADDSTENIVDATVRYMYVRGKSGVLLRWTEVEPPGSFGL